MGLVIALGFDLRVFLGRKNPRALALGNDAKAAPGLREPAAGHAAVDRADNFDYKAVHSNCRFIFSVGLDPSNNDFDVPARAACSKRLAEYATAVGN
jgi:hypothetical protein